MVQKMTSAERLCATLLFYFASGMDAKKVVDSGGRSVGVRRPTDEDLENVLHTTPVAVWNSAFEVAKVLVEDIVANEPRDAITVFKEAAGAMKRGKDFLDSFVAPNGLKPLSDLVDSGKKKGQRK
jgi:hypothetical protein